ncbi:ParA family protein [Bacteroides sp. 519]|uniref:ParA family protein n=1 Tax=Bacteroides sp. 519 TaxID=2302937 RepID=UPI0013D8C6FC|nr:ParA family protein [Bacteroides sp. 519]NDV57961.1 ParA family protein [Bacteroides sp. 519]
MEKKTLLVAFSTQKGGIGKSALTVLMASYFHYVKGYRVGVIDCDYPQYSIHKMRERDKEIVNKIPYYKEKSFNQFKTLGKRNYPIERSPAPEAIDAAKKMIDEYIGESPDIIFFDLPGTLNSEGIVQTLASLDYIFSPISADKMVLQSTLEFAGIINDRIISTRKGKLQGLYLLWNMVDAREKSDLYKIYEDGIGELGLSVMKNSLPDTKRYRHEMSEMIAPIFRCTLFPVDKRLVRGSKLNLLADEIEELINIKQK